MGFRRLLSSVGYFMTYKQSLRWFLRALWADSVMNSLLVTLAGLLAKKSDANIFTFLHKLPIKVGMVSCQHNSGARPN